MGERLALMNGQTLQNAFVPLPGGGAAVYTASGLSYYRHSDWLGSSRLASTPTRTVYSTTAYAPFGEPYAQSGTADLSFTGQNQDTVSGSYDFLAREYATQGRWPSPDPAGLDAADPSKPQSLNRYAYVLNNPLAFIDPFGLNTCWSDNNGIHCIMDPAPAPDPGIHFTDVPGICMVVYTNGMNMSSSNGCAPNPPSDRGGHERSSSGFLNRLGNHLACAAEFGDAHSLASKTGTQDSFLGKALLGNTFSGLTQLVLLAAGGPSRATTTDVGIAMLSGTHQGLPGGGNIGRGPLGVAQDAIVGPVAAAAYNTVAGAGTQTLELGLGASRVATSIAGVTAESAAAAVGIAKVAGDFVVFGYGFAKCK